jgi:hypothetical protein
MVVAEVVDVIYAFLVGHLFCAWQSLEIQPQCGSGRAVLLMALYV